MITRKLPKLSSSPHDNPQHTVWHEVHLNRPYELETVHDILTGICALSRRGPIIWEIRATKGRLTYLLGTPSWSVGRIKAVFSTHASAQFVPVSDTNATPSSEVNPTETNATNVANPARPPVVKARRLNISSPLLPIRVDNLSAMVRSTITSMVCGHQDESVVIQIILGAPHSPSTVPRHLPDPTATWYHTLLQPAHRATPDQHKAAREKASEPSVECVVRIGTDAKNSDIRLHNIISSLRILESAGVKITTAKEQPAKLNHAHLPWRMPLRLSVSELACFMLLPTGETDLPGTPALHPQLLLPPRWLKPPVTIFQDRTFASSLNQIPMKLSISPRDALEHCLILGPTGSGKSTAMLSLILADINANRSVLVLDPKADLVTSILERIPDHRKDDVVVLDPSDPTPVGFNPLDFKRDPGLTSDTILAVFQELFAANWGIRTSDVLGAALNTLARTKDANLLWLIPLLTNADFRERIIRNIHDPIGLDTFWAHYESMSPRERNTEIAPVLNKLRQISLRPGLRNVLGQSHPKFSLTDLFYQRKIILVPLNRGLIGSESARFLGSLIVGLTWTLALSRADIPPEKRHMVSVYIDELQDYLSLPTSFADALAQARGLGVAYTVAHQYRGQLPADVRAGIDTNCRNKIIFTLGPDDAKDLSASTATLSPLDFMSLPRYHIYTSYQSGGKHTGWISGTTIPPGEPTQLAADLKAKSMSRYGVPAEETEKALIQLFTKTEPHPPEKVADMPIGRRRQGGVGSADKADTKAANAPKSNVEETL